MASFLKRLSRGSRSNSYVDDEYDSPTSNKNRSYDHYDSRPNSSGRPLERHTSAQHNTLDREHDLSVSPAEAEAMYSRSGGAPFHDPYSAPPPAHQERRHASLNGMGHNAMPYKTGGGVAPPAEPKMEASAPDLLTQAFNAAVKPYQEKIDQLENQLADLQAWVDQLEHQRTEIHQWIDKRGLRPDVPTSIAKQMDTQSNAAETLNAQLDRKVTIVNFDLHRLQDDLNDSISSAHFADAMLKFLPDIARLTNLPSGPRFAFDLILKLGGNLNSHGGLDTADQEDIQARRNFYGRLDAAMMDVVRARFAENEDWPVQREIKRIEKTAAYLRNFGVEPYFPQTLDTMKQEMGLGFSGRGGAAALAADAPQGGAVGGRDAAAGIPPHQGTPPRYH